jgi:hypothetical protein
MDKVCSHLFLGAKVECLWSGLCKESCEVWANTLHASLPLFLLFTKHFHFIGKGNQQLRVEMNVKR